MSLNPNNNVIKHTSKLATAILDATQLKGDARTAAGIEIERALKEFAKAILSQAEDDCGGKFT